MSNLLAGCCCGDPGCSSPWVVFAPCQQTDQGLDYRAPAMLKTDFDNAGLDVEKVYLWEDDEDCDDYCGRWICVSDAADNLCRYAAGQADDCPECETFDPANPLFAPFEKVLSSEVSTWVQNLTEVDGCCDLQCPTVCDDLGTAIQCNGYDGNGNPQQFGSCPEPCFDASLIQYQLSFNATAVSSATRSYTSSSCGNFTATTTATPSVQSTYVVTVPSTFNACSAFDVKLAIAVVVRIDWNTTPWDCGNDVLAGCGGQCANDEPDPSDYAANDMYTYQLYLIEVPCGGLPTVDTGLGLSYACNTLGISQLCNYSFPDWDTDGSGANDCGGIGVPSGVTISGSATPDSQGYTTRESIGWGGDAICLEWEKTFSFGVANACFPGTGGAVTQGEWKATVALRLSMPDRPIPCELP